jgi:hypothetical protein
MRAGNPLNPADPVDSKTLGRTGGAPDRPDLRSSHGAFNQTVQPHLT